MIWTALALAAIAGLVYSLRPQPVLVDTATAQRGPLRVTVNEDGVTRIRERYVVSSPLSAQLQRITLKVGDPVIANRTVVAQMQPTAPSLLDPRTVAESRARVNAAAQRLEAARAEFKKAEAAVDFAESEMSRVRQLRSSNAASASELDEKQLQFRIRTEEARAAAFGVNIAQYELELAKAALLLTEPELRAAAADDLPAADGGRTGDDTGSAEIGADMQLAIRAPISGRVLRLYEESAGVVAAGQPLMELGDPTDLEIVADVLSVDAVQISPGADVIIDHWGGQRPLSGRVRIVEPSGFTKLSALGVEEQRVNVVIDLLDRAEKRENLGDGFRVETAIVTWQSDDALRIPTSALFRENDQWHVFTIVDGIARSVPVQVGANNGLLAEIVQGLDVGQPVIVHPSDAVQDGTAVQSRQLLPYSSLIRSGTVSTGHSDLRTTFSATLPISRWAMPVRPCVPSTIRSAARCLA